MTPSLRLQLGFPYSSPHSSLSYHHSFSPWLSLSSPHSSPPLALSFVLATLVVYRCLFKHLFISHHGSASAASTMHVSKVGECPHLWADSNHECFSRLCLLVALQKNTNLKNLLNETVVEYFWRMLLHDICTTTHLDAATPFQDTQKHVCETIFSTQKLWTMQFCSTFLQDSWKDNLAGYCCWTP